MFCSHEVGLVSADLGSVQCKVFNPILIEANPNYMYLRKEGKIHQVMSPKPAVSRPSDPPLLETGELSGRDFPECALFYTSFWSLMALVSP